ncbi:MAG: 50S ribosomal protein L4 [Candidatus Buchananbacteria bacterium CG10_big_fil_rev_8_21_14_0_10_42_9]|uniref:Large ribosomal subunit protein uL4 n=1 Tax=Candidatus Buchananbacteria bacterium CG10_big_fil_rev_8_21_14_0_10_42_9 TaxID=1974526 RepID=A0A2H0W229_9BACT|nr:MAG: 50S ribosomal protein L4 [Candidatus Buchananbacteria bacterium CG10_big_fil_rev_8_21_14_0_10_42_9]
MSQVKIYNQTGEELKALDLNDKIFGHPLKIELIWEAVVAQLANARPVLAHTKGRSEVRGGGKKPWRQKGTGRARHGSIRSPIWIGGGVTFGPTKDRNFSKAINKKVKRQALLTALSDKAKNGNIVVVDSLQLESIKTKTANEILHNLKLRTKKTKAKKVDSKSKATAKSTEDSKQPKDPSVLVVLDSVDTNVIRSMKNLPRLTTIQANSLNVYDVVKHQKLLVTEKALAVITKVYGDTAVGENKPKVKA